jgi:hypothetical protein
MVRRILPGPSGSMVYREIPEPTLRAAEHAHATEGAPLFIALDKAGAFKGLDLRGVMRQLGKEVLYEFLLDQASTTFFYTKMEKLPAFAVEYDLRIGLTGLLLEGNKRLDDWLSMRKVFPNPTEPVRPVDDMYARIGALSLSVLDIKLLAQINGENSPVALAELMGVPVYDVYHQLVRLAREEAVVAPGGLEALLDVSTSVEESMKIAFEALDQNDDALALNSALDKVLGMGDGGSMPSAVRKAATAASETKLSLDQLKRPG